MLVNPAARQTCDSTSIQWFTNQSAQSRVLVGTQSVASVKVAEPLWGYSLEFGTSTVGTTHSFTVPTIRGVTYYFRPISVISGYAPVVGQEISFTAIEDPLCGGTGVGTGTGGPVSISTCPSYITDYLRRGRENDINQVIRLQIFLKYQEGIEVPISGTFDEATERGVHAFQNKYRADILEPWGTGTASSGYVYILTKWKINQLMCGGETARPAVTPVVRTTISPPSLQEFGIQQERPIINVEQTASSTPEEPFIIGVQEKEKNTQVAAAAVAVKGGGCVLFKGKSLLSDLLFFIPRGICCILDIIDP